MTHDPAETTPDPAEPGEGTSDAPGATYEQPTLDGDVTPDAPVEAAESGAANDEVAQDQLSLFSDDPEATREAESTITSEPEEEAPAAVEDSGKVGDAGTTEEASAEGAATETVVGEAPSEGEAAEGAAPGQVVEDTSDGLDDTQGTDVEAKDETSVVDSDEVSVEAPKDTTLADEFAPTLSFQSGASVTDTEALAPVLGYTQADVAGYTAPVTERVATMATAPNWYPDPEDPTGRAYRWWDGTTWTDHVRSTNPGDNVTEKGAKRLEKKTLQLITVGLIGVLIGAGLIYTYLGRSDDTAQVVPGTVVTPSIIPTTPSTSAPMPTETTPPPQELVVQVAPPALVPAPTDESFDFIVNVYMEIWLEENATDVAALAQVQAQLSVPLAGADLLADLQARCDQMKTAISYSGISDAEDKIIDAELGNYFNTLAEGRRGCTKIAKASPENLVIWAAEINAHLEQANGAYARATNRLEDYTSGRSDQ